MNTNQVGNSAVDLACILLREHGLEVARADEGTYGYDLLARRPGDRWFTVQVKAAIHDKHSRRFRAKQDHNGVRPYAAGSCDVFLVVDVQHYQAWVIPFGEIRERTKGSARAPLLSIYQNQPQRWELLGFVSLERAA